MPGETWYPATPHICLRRRRRSHQEGEAEPMAEHTEGPRVIRCKGSWLEIGRQYGEELRAEIAHAARALEELAVAAGHDRMSLKAHINGYIPYAQRLPARWDELVGVAQGSCLAIEDVLLMQMLEDLLDVDACTTAGRAGFLLHAEMWFASHTDYAVLISEPTAGPPVITAQLYWVPDRRGPQRQWIRHGRAVNFFTRCEGRSPACHGQQKRTLRRVGRRGGRGSDAISPLRWKRVRHRHPDRRAGCRDLGGHRRCHRGATLGSPHQPLHLRQVPDGCEQ